MKYDIEDYKNPVYMATCMQINADYGYKLKWEYEYKTTPNPWFEGVPAWDWSEFFYRPILDVDATWKGEYRRPKAGEHFVHPDGTLGKWPAGPTWTGTDRRFIVYAKEEKSGFVEYPVVPSSCGKWNVTERHDISTLSGAMDCIGFAGIKVEGCESWWMRMPIKRNTQFVAPPCFTKDDELCTPVAVRFKEESCG